MAKKKIKRKQQYQKPKERTLKEWWRDQSARTQKTILYTAIAVLAAIVLWCVYYYGIYDDGSLKVRNNAIVGAQENWLIGERNKGKNSKYYHIADMADPDGFTRREDSLAGSSSRTQRTDFTYSVGDENTTVYMTAVNDSVDGIAQSVHDRFSSMVAQTGQITDITKETDGSQYFSYGYSYDEDAGTRYVQSVVYYMPTPYADSCVLISSSATAESTDVYQLQDDLLAMVQQAKAGLTLVKP